jgi:hypothetical protein
MDYGRGVLALEPKTAEQLYTAAACAGGPTTWGLEEHTGGNATVMPVLFARTAIKRVLEAIRELMATNVVPDIAPESQTPFQPRFWIPAPEDCLRLRLLAGLTNGPPFLANSVAVS